MTEDAEMLLLAIVNQSTPRLGSLLGRNLNLEAGDLSELFNAIGKAYAAEESMNKCKGRTLAGFMEKHNA